MRAYSIVISRKVWWKILKKGNRVNHQKSVKIRVPIVGGKLFLFRVGPGGQGPP